MHTASRCPIWRRSLLSPRRVVEVNRWINRDVEAGPVPTFGAPKNGCARDVTLSSDTVNLLRQHKRAQAELKMANRTTYRDHGLVFAKEYCDLTNRADMIGLPCRRITWDNGNSRGW